MKILFLAPQPFYIERGTPIAVRLALEVLGSDPSDTSRTIDLLTYHVGQPIKIKGVQHHRIPALPGITSVTPGISLKKLICDVFFLFTSLVLACKARNNRYDLVHAVEESVFIALLIKLIWGTPYVYDMDSCLTQQLVDKWKICLPLKPFFDFWERLAVKNALAVVPVCDALAEIASRHGSAHISILRDISLYDKNDSSQASNLRGELSLPKESELIIYIGNLERYQGIDLLIESFSMLAPTQRSSHLVIVGGSAEHIEKYKQLSKRLSVSDRIHFLGAQPLNQLHRFYAEADILVSPRIQGSNTPMKIYTYLHSGKAIVATDLLTHTQVLTPSVSVLSKPNKEAFSQALLDLLNNKDRREQLGNAARTLAEENYTFDVFKSNLTQTYLRLREQTDIRRTA